ncbi:MAG: EAL domain-containing protein [Sulfurimonas sp.]|nr:EAL domain-containing protein [Sulfurimonas sp.]
MKLTKKIIKSIMDNEDYGVSYEPIVDIKNMNIIGYEALSRFKYEGKAIAPDIFFKSLHKNLELFFDVESVIKTYQIKNRPKGKKLFINLDPDVATKPKHIMHWIKLFNSTTNIVVEIIENSDDENIVHIEHFMNCLEESNVDFAYDDFSKPNSVFVSSLFHRASTIKLDMDFIRTIQTNRAYIEVAKGIVRYAKLSNKHTVLEGVETQNDLDVVKEIGVDFIQGYLFKDKFIDKYKESLIKLSIIQKETPCTINAVRCTTISAAQYIQEINIDYDLIAECSELEEDVINSIHKAELLTTEILTELSRLFNNYAKALASLFEFKDLSNTLKVLSALLYNTAVNDLSDEHRSSLRVSIESLILDIQNWRLAIFIKQDASDIHYLDSRLLSSIDFHFARVNKGKSYFFN